MLTISLLLSLPLVGRAFAVGILPLVMREFPLFWVATLVGGIRVTGELRVIVG